MTNLQRIQLRRTAGFNLQAASMALNELPVVNCARGTGRIYGNPYCATHYGNGWHGNAIAAKLYECWIDDTAQSQLLANIKKNLPGHNLACWCRREDPCHCDVLLKLANPS